MQAMQLQLLDVGLTALCSMPLINTGRVDATSKMVWGTALYQNNQQCIGQLSQAASVKVVSQVVPGSTFCLDDLQLLPSEVTTPTAGEQLINRLSADMLQLFLLTSFLLFSENCTF